MRLSLRSTAPLILMLTVAACSTTGTSNMPAHSMQSEAQTKNGAHCKTLPLIDTKTPSIAVGRRRDLTDSGCGIRAIHEAVSHTSSGNIQVFDVPDAIQVKNCSPYEVFDDCGTFGIALNASGTIVGYYLNSTDAIASFIRTPDGSFTSFQAHNTLPTQAYDITNAGAIVGQYFDGRGVLHGFVRHKNGSLTGYEAPWASQIPDDSVGQGTSPGAINARGETGGIYFDSQGLIHGFIRQSNGSFVQVSPDSSVTSSVCLTCINNRGNSAGDYSDSSGIGRGFMRSAAGMIKTVAKRGRSTRASPASIAATRCWAFSSTRITWSGACLVVTTRESCSKIPKRVRPTVAEPNRRQ